MTIDSTRSRSCFKQRRFCWATFLLLGCLSCYLLIFVINQYAGTVRKTQLSQLTSSAQHDPKFVTKRSRSVDKNLIISVNSARRNSRNRLLIRETWGSLKKWDGWLIRIVFMLGQGGFTEDGMISKSLHEENEYFNDLVISKSFIDSYENLTLKTMMAYKWLASQKFDLANSTSEDGGGKLLKNETVVVKADDDVFINIFQLINSLNSGIPNIFEQPSFFCDVKAGTKPLRENSKDLLLVGALRWVVTKEEYPQDVYPRHCGGAAYIVTMEAIKSVVSVVDEFENFFKFEDIFMTGLTVQKFNSRLNHTTRDQFVNIFMVPEFSLYFILDGRGLGDVQNIFYVLFSMDNDIDFDIVGETFRILWGKAVTHFDD